MEQLFPSEIARLVLGYLKEECSEAATMFEAKSLNLIEYRLLTLQKKNPPTTINGMALNNILNQYIMVVSYIQSKLKELTQSQAVSNSGDLIENLKTIIKTVGEKKSDQNEVSVLYENIIPKQDGTENVKKMKLDCNEEKKPDITVKDENIKSEKLTKEQENKLVHIFRSTNYIHYTERRRLAEKLGLPEMLIKSWFQKRRNEIRDRLRRRYTLHRDSGDSDDTVYDPRPSTSHAANEYDMNCTSSSQRVKLRSSEIEKRNSND